MLGVVLSGLTFILTFGQVKIDLKKTLGDVLDARKKDPTALATGAIAGRVEGQVELSNLEVNNATVKNVNNNTGGFVGYIVGKTQYDGLSNALGELVDLLTNILNVIPGLGLGDLITILLGNAIPLENVNSDRLYQCQNYELYCKWIKLFLQHPIKNMPVDSSVCKKAPLLRIVL